MVFLAEYDALVGTWTWLRTQTCSVRRPLLRRTALKSVIDEVGGEVRLYGTPGEEGGENGSAKGSFVREGYFKDVDAALSAHPGVGHRSDRENTRLRADRYRVLGEGVSSRQRTGTGHQCPGRADPDIQLHQCASPAPGVMMCGSTGSS